MNITFRLKHFIIFVQFFSVRKTFALYNLLKYLSHNQFGSSGTFIPRLKTFLFLMLDHSGF